MTKCSDIVATNEALLKQLTLTSLTLGITEHDNSGALLNDLRQLPNFENLAEVDDIELIITGKELEN